MLSGLGNGGPEKKRNGGGAPEGSGAVAGDLGATLRGSVRASFDPERYRDLNSLVQRQGWNLLTAGIDFGADPCVVDLGSGHGGNTAALAAATRPMRSRVIGVDVSGDMVAQANKDFPISKFPNVVFLEGRAENVDAVLRAHERVRGVQLPAITHVVSNYTLHWVRDPANPDRFLHGEMFRRLNRRQDIGGEQHHLCAECEAFKELFKAGYDLIGEESRWQEFFPLGQGGCPWRHPRLVDGAELSKALKEAGYAGTIEKRTEERVFRSDGDLTAWVGAMIRPFMERIPEGLRGDFAAGWIARYLKDNPAMRGTDGAVKLLDRNLLVRAKKIGELAD